MRWERWEGKMGGGKCFMENNNNNWSQNKQNKKVFHLKEMKEI